MTTPIAIRRERAARLFKEGKSPTAVATAIGVDHRIVGRWRRELLVCDRCAEPLRNPAPDGLCGWCVEETTGSLAA